MIAGSIGGAPGVEDEQPDFGFLGAAQSAPPPLLFDDILAVAQPCRVGKDDRIALEIDRHLDNVARGPRHR